MPEHKTVRDTVRVLFSDANAMLKVQAETIRDHAADEGTSDTGVEDAVLVGTIFGALTAINSALQALTYAHLDQADAIRKQTASQVDDSRRLRTILDHMTK